MNQFVAECPGRRHAPSRNRIATGCALVLLLLFASRTHAETVHHLFAPGDLAKGPIEASEAPIPPEMPPVLRARTVEFAPALSGPNALQKGDRLILNLFEDTVYEGAVDRVAVNINGTVTVRARIEGSQSGFALFATTDGRTLGTVQVPEEGLHFHLQSGPDRKTHYIVELDPKGGQEPLCGCCAASTAKDGTVESVIPPNVPEPGASLDATVPGPKQGEDDPARIDLMLVYTPAAEAWADANSGGIENVMAVAVELAQLAHDESGTQVTLPVVHSALVDYVESGCGFVDLRRITVTADFDPYNQPTLNCRGDNVSAYGFLDEVHTMRDAHAADAVVMFNDMNSPAGIAWVLANPNGLSAFGYSVNSARYAGWTFTFGHELGHNMGAGHNKDQLTQPGPGLFSYSGGGRWVGQDEVPYCSIMTYQGGEHFEDGVYHFRAPVFSDPNSLYEGVATGDPLHADNARTLRQTKQPFTGYRSRVLFETDETAGASLTGNANQVAALRANCTPVQAVPPAGWVFVNWTRDGEEFSTDNPLTVESVVEEMTLIANFEPDAFKLTYIPGEDGTITGETEQFVLFGEDGSPVEAVPVPPSRFSQWSDGRTDNPRVDTGVTDDLTVTAIFISDFLPVTYLAALGGSIVGPSEQQVWRGEDGEPVTAVPGPGYQFAAWSDGRTDNPRVDTHVTEELTVTAQFALFEYEVNYQAGDNGSIQGFTPQIVVHGSNSAAVRAVPDPDHHFVQWDDGIIDNPRRDTQVTGDLVITALFHPNYPPDPDITGGLRDAVTDEPIACAVILLIGPGPGDEAVFVADANGQFAIAGLAAGTYQLWITAPGYESALIEDIVLTGDEPALLDTLTLTPRAAGPRIHGRVTHAVTGDPLVGVQVSASTDADGVIAETITCADGQYELPIPARAQAWTVELQYALDNFVPVNRAESAPLEGETAVDEVLQPLAAGASSIAGTVRAAGEKNGPIPGGARVILQGPISAAVETDDEGNYGFDALLPGEYSLLATASGYARDERQRSLPEGGAATLHFDLAPLEEENPFDPADINRDGVVNAIDVQLVINAALGNPIAFEADVNADSLVNAVDVQLVVNAALGGGG